MQLLLGIDVGTSGCKVTAIDGRGAVVATGARTYSTSYPRPGWAEQAPEDWYRVACQAVRACLRSGELDPRYVVGLSVDGPAHNVALMDEGGQVLYPAIHWSDLRSVAQSERLERQYGERIYEITYQRPNPSWTLSQLLWLRENEPGVWSRLRRILVTKDYVRCRLTRRRQADGRQADGYGTDVYDAIGTQLYDVAHDCWSAEIADIVGFSVDWLPPVSRADAIAGELQPDAASDMGLPPGVPVAVGSGDSVVEAFGVGAVDAGHCIVKLGTAANVNLVTVRPQPSPKTLTYRHVVGGRGFTIAATNSGASTVRWFRGTFCRREVAQAVARGTDVYELIGQLASGAPAGCEGLLFHPYLMGERSPYWDPRLRGDYVGISARHQTRHFARAILEGVSFSIRDCLEAVAELGQPILERRLLGGGAKSPLWRQILCDVLGQPLIVPAVEGASYGAALLAGVALSVFPTWRAAVEACIRPEATLYPDPEAQTLYDRYFNVYRAVTRDLAVHSHRLAELAAKDKKADPLRSGP